MIARDAQTDTGREIFAKIKSNYLMSVRSAAFNLTETLSNLEVFGHTDHDEETVQFLDTVEYCSSYAKKLHRALMVLEDACVIP